MYRKIDKNLHIYGIKTNDGVFLSEKPLEGYSSYGSSLKGYIINGEKPSETFNERWVKVKDEPTQIQVKQSRPDINHRYELIDKSLESEKFPLVFKREDAAYYDEEDYFWAWKSDFKHLQSLYELKSDKQEDELVDVDFKYESVAEVDEIKSPEGFSFKVLADSNWDHKGTRELKENSVTHQLIDKIMFPDILLNNKPCKFTSEQMYNIVRQYIKQHIDYDVAEITSDYRFCFTVVKKIDLNNPYTIKNEITKSNGRPYRKPRYNSKYVDNRKVEVFEMTYSPENYKGYTPIPEMVGENIEDLKEKVDKYCEDLIKVINKPLKNCPTCEGKGVLVNQKD